MADGEGRIEFYRSNPRSIIELDSLHVSKSLRRTLRKGTFEVRINYDFGSVIRACADRGETWIDEEITAAFTAFHRAEKAHSVEAYMDDELVGGLYGVSVGGAFMGESMFSRRPDASKVCLVRLVERLRERGFILLDCQIHNDHLARMGAVEIPEEEFLLRLNRASALERSFG